MEKKPKFLLLKGLPLSGKTEYANQWVREDSRRVRLSWTDILTTFGPGTDRDKQALALECAIHIMREALTDDMSVVLDEENLSVERWNLFFVKAKNLHADVEWYTTPASLHPEQLIEKNHQLGSPVPDEDFRRKFELFEKWLRKNK